MILFTGCSFTKGAGLENPLTERYSSYFNGDNVARNAWSNDSIVRSVLENEKGYDKVVVQLTFCERMYHPKRDYLPSYEHCKSYFAEHYEDEMGSENFWKNVWVLKKILGDRLFLLNVRRPASNSWTLAAGECPMISIRELIGDQHLDPLYTIQNPLYNPCGHPTAEGHKIIADKIKEVLCF